MIQKGADFVVTLHPRLGRFTIAELTETGSACYEPEGGGMVCGVWLHEPALAPSMQSTNRMRN